MDSRKREKWMNELQGKIGCEPRTRADCRKYRCASGLSHNQWNRLDKIMRECQSKGINLKEILNGEKSSDKLEFMTRCYGILTTPAYAAEAARMVIGAS
jgi:hypothetical protein